MIINTMCVYDVCMMGQAAGETGEAAEGEDPGSGSSGETAKDI